MKIYFYDPQTLEYVGQGESDYNPVSKQYDIIPAFATEVAPPANLASNQAAIFKDGGWTIVTKQTESDAGTTTELTEEQKIAQNNANIKSQIIVLEEKGVRAMREVLLTGSEESKSRLQTIDNQIAELRKQLQ